MYFPYLRGKQYELIAIRELVDKGLISSEKVIPVIEPVKQTSTFKKLLDEMGEKEHYFSVIQNPEVGNYEPITEKYITEYKKKHFFISGTLINSFESVDRVNISNVQKGLVIFKNDTSFKYVTDDLDRSDFYKAIPDNTLFRRRFKTRNLILFGDKFVKKDRNADYVGLEPEFFSADHLFYKSEGYIGFGDYSVIGEHYIDGGFAPLAVAIHIVYFNEKNELYVRHFTSDSNDDISNPAGKFSEALKKFAEWYKNTDSQNRSYGADALLEYYDKQKYPGLGVVKKLAIMHHLEIMNRYLESKNA